jgi:hypothetical protein
MSVIVTDCGFDADEWTGAVAPLAVWAGEPGVEVPEGAGWPAVEHLLSGAPGSAPDSGDAPAEGPGNGAPALVRIAFASFADGRGFTLARRLRQAGYAGRLRAAGHVLADQYAMARRSGFDEVEIDDDLARRQPEPTWRARADCRAHDYQSRLGRRGSPSPD